MAVINGFINNSCIPLSYEILAETGFPSSEALTSGLVLSVYSLIRIVLKGLNKLLSEDSNGVHSYAYCFVLIVMVFLSFVLMFFAKIRHRRL
jgi:hypothetical protein